MTLNLTIVSVWGVWQCSDNRLVDAATGRVVSDYSVKQVELICSDGSALLAYAGAGRIRDVDVSDWIRETLRGETRTVDQSLILLRENATRDIAPLLQSRGISHMFSIGTIIGTRRWMVQIRNFDVDQYGSRGSVRSSFTTATKEITAGGEAFVFPPEAVSEQDLKKLRAAAMRKPRKPKDFSDLLGAVNLRASQTKAGKKAISGHCLTCYLPSSAGGIQGEVRGAAGTKRPRPTVVPTLLWGIDLTDSTKTMLTRMAALKGLLTLDQGELEAFEHPGQDDVTPKNRLRR